MAMEKKQPKYKRVLIKVSGEALAGDAKMGIDGDTIDMTCSKIKEIFYNNLYTTYFIRFSRSRSFCWNFL